MMTKITKFTYILMEILWPADPILGGHREISNYTMTVTRQRHVNNKRGTVFSVQSVPKCYKTDKLGVREITAGVLVL
jgi:hypothetical protein